MNAHYYIDSFVNYLIAERHYSKATAMVYSAALTRMLDFAESRYGLSSWEAVDDLHVREWVVQMMTDKCSARTVNKKLSALRSFYRYMMIKGFVAKNPTQKIHGLKNEKKLPVFVRENEMNFLFDKVCFGEGFEGQRDRLILLMFYSTGIRLSELVGLDVDSVDFYNSTIKVVGKRNKERIIPFGAELRNELQDYLDVRERQPGVRQTEALFLGKRGMRVSCSFVEKTVHAYLSQVTTLKKCSPHVLRHTFATAMLNNGAEIEVVRQLLGHESIATTEIYTHTTFEELKKAYFRAHPRAGEED